MRLGSLWEKKASQTEVGWRKAIVPPEILQCCTEQLWSPNPQAWALNVYSTRVHTEQTGVQVSYFGAALCWESKQSCLYSLNADDEWADGMNRLSVISTWSYREILHRLWMTKGGQGVDGWGGGGGVWGVRQCAVMCCTMHHPRRPAGLRSTLQSLCLFRLCLHSLRSQSELTRLPPLDFFQFSFLFYPEWSFPRDGTVSSRAFQQLGNTSRLLLLAQHHHHRQVWYPAVLTPRGQLQGTRCKGAQPVSV